MPEAAYERKTWGSGDYITTSNMNNIETGIVSARNILNNNQSYSGDSIVSRLSAIEQLDVGSNLTTINNNLTTLLNGTFYQFKSGENNADKTVPGIYKYTETDSNSNEINCYMITIQLDAVNNQGSYPVLQMIIKEVGQSPTVSYSLATHAESQQNNE